MSVLRWTPAQYAEIAEHTTPRQQEVISSLVKHGTAGRAAKALGVSRDAIKQTLVRAKGTAARVDPSAHARGAPPGYMLKGASTLVNAKGETIVQWIKTTRDLDKAAAVLDAFRAMLEEDPLPAAKVSKAPKATHDDSMTVYPMGDPHLGMLAWAPETGQDFNIKIAESNLVAAVDHLVDLAPPTKEALIVDLGDFFHSDNNAGVTSRSGVSLDTDTRWAKILRVGLRTLWRCIDRAAEKHAHVKVICAVGNHDDHAALMLALALEQRYRNEPRVTIDTSPAKFHFVEFGKNLIGVTHGDTIKATDLPGVMAVDQKEAWGRTDHRMWLCGHVHHTSLKEYPGCTVETFRTLAARDAWHTAKGYRSGRSMVCDVLHREHGPTLRHQVGIEQVITK